MPNEPGKRDELRLLDTLQRHAQDAARNATNVRIAVAAGRDSARLVGQLRDDGGAFLRYVDEVLEAAKYLELRLEAFAGEVIGQAAAVDAELDEATAAALRAGPASGRWNELDS